MSFSRHAESIGPMFATTENLGPGAASRWSAPEPSPRAPREGTTRPAPSSAMSSDRLFLDRVALQQSPSPLTRHTEYAIGRRMFATEMQRMVNCAEFSCLTRRVQSRT